MKILITGFDPFGGESVNPAYEAVKLLPDTIAGAEIIKLQVPTRFTLSGTVLEAAVNEHRPDAVICVGQAGGRSAITPERVAINLADASIPDNAGDQPVDAPIRKDGAPARKSHGAKNKSRRYPGSPLLHRWLLCVQLPDVYAALSHRQAVSCHAGRLYPCALCDGAGCQQAAGNPQHGSAPNRARPCACGRSGRRKRARPYLEYGHPPISVSRKISTLHHIGQSHYFSPSASLTLQTTASSSR